MSPVLGSPDGARFEAKSMRGRWYLLNVWGTWCAECRDEHAALLQIKASGKAPIVGLDWKDQPQDACPGCSSSATLTKSWPRTVTAE